MYLVRDHKKGFGYIDLEVHNYFLFNDIFVCFNGIYAMSFYFLRKESFNYNYILQGLITVGNYDIDGFRVQHIEVRYVNIFCAIKN